MTSCYFWCINRYFIHKGFVENVLPDNINLPSKISFAYVDLDLFEPTKIVLDYLHKIASDGAIIIVDDYNFFSTGVKTAVDDFLKRNNSNLIRYECMVPDKRYGYFAVITKKLNSIATLSELTSMM